MPKHTCPDQGQLQAMFAAQLPEDQLLDLAAHLRDCGNCQDCFERLAQRVDLPGVDLPAPTSCGGPNSIESLEPELRRVIRELTARPTAS